MLHRSHGGPEVLVEAEVDEPRPGPDELLVEVRACAVNRLDLLQREGPPVVPNFSMPHVPGMDIAGVVAALGSDVEGWAVGDDVVLDPVTTCGACDRCIADRAAYCPALRTLGSTRWGGYAELVTVPARNAHPLPTGAAYVEAAALPVAYVTAWMGIVEVGQLRAGERVLVMGAGSGVTIAALRIARQLGASVVTTAGSDAVLDRAGHELDVDAVVDRRRPDLVEALVDAAGGDGFDLVLDHVGPAQLQTQIDALAPDGRLVLSGTTTGTDGAFSLPSLYHAGKSLLGLGGARQTTFTDMLAAVDRHDLHMVVDDVVPLSSASAVHARIEAGDFFGKLVLVP